MFFERVADYLDEHKERLAHEVNERTFREIKGYQDSGMPKDESEQSILRLINFIISNMRKQEEPFLQDDEFLKDLISFEEGIASKRVHYRLDLVDLLHGIRICRNKIWDYLRRCFTDEYVDPMHFFKLERRINTLVVYFCIAISEMYLSSRDRLIESQNSALLKWEEVVKSTSRLDLKIPCREEFAAIVRAQAEAIARRLNYDEEKVSDIIMAVGEACDNAIEHGVSEKGIDIFYTISKEALTVEVIDYGKGFDPQGKGDEHPDLFSERGRGIFIMKNLVDVVDIKSTPGEGTHLAISVNRVFK